MKSMQDLMNLIMKRLWIQNFETLHKDLVLHQFMLYNLSNYNVMLNGMKNITSTNFIKACETT